MSKLETILIVFVLFILVTYIGFMSYLMFKLYMDNKNAKATIDPKENIDLNVNSPYQTEFFNKSATYAEKVLFGKVFIQEYGEPSYYGNKLIDVINRLNQETKRSIVVAIKYMTIEPASSRNNERLFRVMAEQEKVPVWFIILREATKKVVPDFITDQSTYHNKDNVVSLYNVA